MTRIWSKHIPPSVNAAYRNRTSRDSARAPGRIKTKLYKSWFSIFGYECNLAMRGQSPIMGPYRMVIIIDRDLRHHASDISNRIKALEDALVELKVIKDDRFAERVSIEWGEAYGGMLVEIEPVDPT